MTISQASAKLTLPPRHLLKFPPDPLPRPLPPPHDNPSFAHPFTIPPNLYTSLLSVNVPITIALVYATTVSILNRYNARRSNKPWTISKTRLFRYFVIVHNIVLAAYSFWTFLGMINTIRISVPRLADSYGLSGIIDSLCKIHGPRGFGNGATWEPFTQAWKFANENFTLDAAGQPDHTDVGRIWNEGLAFYGWLFYVSKFYEVVDTFIILAKGRKSSVLQTYHHAGAMMCMWAGIRYMAPPIWMFVLVNSGIHSLMYTYYTLSTLHVPVPMAIKRLLTTMQITQFVVGANFAFSHLFVAYSIPASTPTFLAAEPSSSTPVAASTASPPTFSTTPLLSWFQDLALKLLLRASASEPLAENVPPNVVDPSISDRHSQAAGQDPGWKTIHCTDTSGQAFAILFNCVYLAPLTVLFLRFFVRSYSRSAKGRAGGKGKAAVDEAVRGVKREVEGNINGGVVEEEKGMNGRPKGMGKGKGEMNGKAH